MNEIFVDMSGRENISETGYGGHLLPKADHDTHRKEEQYCQRSSSIFVRKVRTGIDCIGWLAELDADPKHMSRTEDELDICDSAYLIFPGKNLTE